MQQDQPSLNHKLAKFPVGDFVLTMSMEQSTIIFQFISSQNADLFKKELTVQNVKTDSVLSIIFIDPANIFQYLVKNPSEITMSKTGEMQITGTVMGKNRKFQIKAQKVEISKEDLLIRTIKLLHQSYRQNLQISSSEIYEKENKMWRSLTQNKFETDTSDPHYHMFERYGNLIRKKHDNGIWKNIYGMELKARSIFTFKALQVRCSNQMYGVASNRVRGFDNIHSIVGECILYHITAPGNLQPGSIAQTTGGVANGQTIEVIIDTTNWLVTWKKNSIILASAPIPVNIRNLPIFPVITMNVVGNQIEFV